MIMRDWKKINLNPIGDGRGNLIALEHPKQLPFELNRVYYIYGVPKNQRRGFHSHNDLEQLLIAVSGKVTILVKTQSTEENIVLDSPDKGLYIGPMIWREMYDFSDDAVLMVLASHKYDESDYIRDYDEYLKFATKAFKEEK